MLGWSIIFQWFQLLDMHCGQETGLVNENKGKNYLLIQSEFPTNHIISPKMYQLRTKSMYQKIGCLLEIEAKYLFALEFLEGLFGKQSGKGNSAPLQANTLLWANTPTSSKYAHFGRYAKSPKKNQGGSTKGGRKPTLVEIYSESFMSEGNSNQAKTKYTFVRFTYLALN